MITVKDKFSIFFIICVIGLTMLSAVTRADNIIESEEKSLNLEKENIPSYLSIAGEKQYLNGAGVRRVMFNNVYVVALYSSLLSDNAKALIEADIPMTVRVYITSGLVTADRFADHTMEGFEKSTEGEMSKIRPQIEDMIGSFRNSLQKDDIWDLSYDPKRKVVTIYQNNKFVVEAQSLEFKQAMIGIWLSKDPVQKSLKKALLTNR